MGKTWEADGERGGRSPSFSRQFNDWELDKVESFFWKLQSLVIKREMEDKLRWNESKCGKFNITSLFSSLSRRYKEPFSPSIVSRSWAPMKVRLFAWEAS